MELEEASNTPSTEGRKVAAAARMARDLRFDMVSKKQMILKYCRTKIVDQDVMSVDCTRVKRLDANKRLQDRERRTLSKGDNEREGDRVGEDEVMREGKQPRSPMRNECSRRIWSHLF